MVLLSAVDLSLVNTLTRMARRQADQIAEPFVGYARNGAGAATASGVLNAAQSVRFDDPW